MSKRNRYICLIRAPLSAWTPPQGAGVVALDGLGWHMVYGPWAQKSTLAGAVAASGLECRDWGLTYGEVERILRLDASNVLRAFAKGTITGAQAATAAGRYDAAMTQLEAMT